MVLLIWIKPAPVYLSLAPGKTFYLAKVVFPLAYGQTERSPGNLRRTIRKETDMGILIRWGLAFLLLAATFNPTDWNFVQWARANYATQMSVTVLLGLLLLVGYIIYLRATLRSIGTFGMALVLALVAALLWVLYDLGWLDLENATQNTWIGLVSLSFVLGIGLSWSHVRRKISGQSDMDDVDD